MADSLSAVAIAAAVGAVAGKFVETAWGTSEKWLHKYFDGHRQAAQKKAENNSLAFLQELGRKVEELESSGMVQKKQLLEAPEEPDFSVLLQKAVIASSQTESDEKHRILAKIVSERLRVNGESIVALASKIACDAVSYASVSQLKVLGFLAAVFRVSPSKLLSADAYALWLDKRLSPFLNLDASWGDLLHLETLSCIRIMEHTRGANLAQLLAHKNGEQLDTIHFADSSLGRKVVDLWATWRGESQLQYVRLTTVGEILGVYVSDLLFEESDEIAPTCSA